MLIPDSCEVCVHACGYILSGLLEEGKFKWDRSQDHRVGSKYENGPPQKKKIQKGTGNFNRQKRHLIKFSVLLTKTSKPHRRELAVPEDRCKYPDSAS